MTSLAALAPAAPAGVPRIDRVVVVSDDLAASGGAGGVARESVVRLSQLGLSVTALVGVAASVGGLPEQVEVTSLFGGELKEHFGLKTAVNGVFDLGVRNRLARWIAERDTPSTVYHLHNWHKSLSPSVFHAFRPVEDRLLMTAHDYFLVCPNGAYYNFQTRQGCDLTPLSSRCLIEHCDKRRYLHKVWRVARQGVRTSLFPLETQRATILAPHAGVAPYLMRGGVRPDRIEVLNNPVTPWTDRRVAAKTNNRVLFVGRLEEDKGIHLAAEAAERCGVSLTVIGDGPLAIPLARKYPRHQFVGRKTREEIRAIAFETRLLVVAPLWPETFGLVTFEGLLSGVPTLLSRNALVAEDLRARHAVEVFDVDDQDALSTTMARLLRDPERLAELSANGFALRDQLALTPEAWGRRLVNLYQTTLSPRAGQVRQGLGEEI